MLSDLPWTACIMTLHWFLGGRVCVCRFHHYTQWPFYSQMHAPDILFLNRQNSQERPPQPITLTPLGASTRIIFLPCWFSVEKSVRKVEPLLFAPRLAYLPAPGLQADLSQGAILSCGSLNAAAGGYILANHG